MFEAFSRGYYLGRMYVQPSDDDRAAMDRSQHERVNEQLYAEGEGVERLDRPLVMKLDTSHFAVHGDEAVPSNTLAVPTGLLDETRVRNPPTLREVLLAKADHAARLLDVTGRWPGGADPDDGDAGGDGPSGPAGI
jgi:hypothetical protein